MALIPSAEFSFILAREGARLGALSRESFSLLLAATVATAVLAPPLYRLAPALEAALRALPSRPPRPPADIALPIPSVPWHNHVVICGAGRVGTVIARVLRQRGQGYVFVEIDRRRVEVLRAEGEPVIYGDAANTPVLDQTCLERARTLVVAIPDPVSALRIVDEAHRRHPRLDIIARAAGGRQATRLRSHGAAEAVIAERELAIEMTRHALHRIGVPTIEAQAVLHRLRFEPEQP
jgi:CPA2 family monovalent cation:H+ antiporter-2